MSKPIYTWKGVRIENLSRADLIEALKEAIRATSRWGL